MIIALHPVATPPKEIKASRSCTKKKQSNDMPAGFHNLRHQRIPMLTATMHPASLSDSHLLPPWQNPAAATQSMPPGRLVSSMVNQQYQYNMCTNLQPHTIVAESNRYWGSDTSSACVPEHPRHADCTETTRKLTRRISRSTLARHLFLTHGSVPCY
jgi:hypothetical protein